MEIEKNCWYYKNIVHSLPLFTLFKASGLKDTLHKKLNLGHRTLASLRRRHNHTLFSGTYLFDPFRPNKLGVPPPKEALMLVNNEFCKHDLPLFIRNGR